MNIDLRTLLAENPAVLAPMAGVNEAPFRAICKRMGAGLTYTEMIGATALLRNPKGWKSERLLTLDPGETPCAVQIFGSDAGVMAEQARRIVERHGAAVACIDINMGCPVPKIVARGAGCALMREPDGAAGIVRRVVAACGIPVTVKIRKGWDDTETNAVEFALAMEEAGAAAIGVHGRTRDQLYRGSADWDAIAAVKAAVRVPVLGSGDVFRAADVKAMIDWTGVDGVMVARGAQGNPWIFREVRALLGTGAAIAPPTLGERFAVMREHAAALAVSRGDWAFKHMRKHVSCYVNGLPGANFLRERANEVCGNGELDALLVEYFEFLKVRAGRSRQRVSTVDAAA